MSLPRRPAFEQFWNLSHIRGKLVLIEAEWSEGKESYPPSLKVANNIEMVDLSLVRGYAQAAIAKILKKAKSLVLFEQVSITEGIASCTSACDSISVQSRVRIRCVQTPFVVRRCSALFKKHRCEYRVHGGKCNRGHQESEFPSFLKIGVWLTLLDADMDCSIQRRAWVRPAAFAEVTGIPEKEILKMNIGFQQTIADSLKDGVFVAQFLIGKRFIQLVKFMEA